MERILKVWLVLIPLWGLAGLMPSRGQTGGGILYELSMENASEWTLDDYSAWGETQEEFDSFGLRWEDYTDGEAYTPEFDFSSETYQPVLEASGLGVTLCGLDRNGDEVAKYELPLFQPYEDALDGGLRELIDRRIVRFRVVTRPDGEEKYLRNFRVVRQEKVADKPYALTEANSGQWVLGLDASWRTGNDFSFYRSLENYDMYYVTYLPEEERCTYTYSPIFDLSGYDAPMLCFRGYNVTVLGLDQDGKELMRKEIGQLEYTNWGFSVAMDLDKRIVQFRLEGTDDKDEYGMSEHESWLRGFTIRERKAGAAISRFPYTLAADNSQEWIVNGYVHWGTATTTEGFNFSFWDDHASNLVESPLLDLSGLERPVLTFDGYGTVYGLDAAGDTLLRSGIGYNQSGAQVLMLDKRIVRLHFTDGYFTDVGIQNGGSDIIDVFPYVLTAENCCAWTLGENAEWQTDEDGSFGLEGTTIGAGDTYSPVFDFSSLASPLLEVSISGTLYALDGNGNTVASYGASNDKVVLDKRVARFRCDGRTAFRNFRIYEQPVIDTFPYVLTPNASGWELSCDGGGWSTSGPVIQASGMMDLQSPQLDIPGVAGTLVIEASAVSSNILYVIGYGETGDVIFEDFSVLDADMKSFFITFPKEVKSLSLSNSWEATTINSLLINSVETMAEWTEEEDGTYTVPGGEYVAGQTAYVQLPDIQRATKVGVTFDVSATSWDNVELYFTDNGTEYEAIAPENGEVAMELDFSASRFIPGFRAVYKGGKAGSISISNFHVRTLASSNVMQFDLSCWFDNDGDGQMEFCSEGGIYRYVNGALAQLTALQGVSEMWPYNVNNDRGMDFLVNGEAIYTYDEEGNLLMTEQLVEGNDPVIPCDYNNDGLTDFLLPKTNRVAIQIVDGSFRMQDYKTYTQEEYLNRDKVSEEWRVAERPSGIVSSTFGDAFLSGSDMFIGGAGSYGGNLGGQASNIDFNKDGLPDIVDTGTGSILVYVAEDKYVSLPMGGAIYFRDLNGDMRQDYVVYEPDTKTVSAHVHRADGTEEVQELLRNLSMDQRIWCCDLDKDGDVDILLPFSYLDSNGAAFLVVMENDGTGRFKMHEAAYDEMLDFKACADIDGDGYYEVLATYSESDKVSEYHDVLLLEADGKYQFGLRPEPLVRLERRLVENSSYPLKLEIETADIDGDGYYDLLTRFEFRHLNYAGVAETSTTVEVYAIKDLLPEARANQAPAKPAKPSFLYEAESGLLKVNWAQGSDTESSPADLTYALRVGSGPGKGDIFYAHAGADGRRLNLQDGNMGHELDRIINASGWQAGKYYIAVQAIDPAHRGSAWSDEAVFEKARPSAAFRLMGGRTVADTLTLSLTAGRVAGLVYQWDLDGARVVSQNADETVYGIVFDTPGDKRVALSVTDGDGNVSVADQQVSIAANKLTEGDLGIDNYTVTGFMDMDNDGLPELLTGNGVYESDGKGNYTKLKKIYNTNLTFSPEYHRGLLVTDVNKDGWADVILPFNAVNGYIYHYINEGDKVLALESHEGKSMRESISGMVDFNNDGFMDTYCHSDYFANTYCLNAGNDLDFTRIETGLGSGYLADVDKDGFYDIVQDVCEADETYALVYARGNGDGTFTRMEIPMNVPDLNPGGSFDISALTDMDNDGYLDIVLLANDRTLVVLLNNRNEAFDRMVSLTLPDYMRDTRLVYCMDFDNNGRMDFAIEAEGADYGKDVYILYLYDHWEYKLVLENSGYNFGELLATVDLDGDGVPDMMENGYYDGFVKNRSTVGNSRPEAPQNIRFSQNASFVTLQWDAAKDNETPSAHLRYNVSVKKQGATGAGAYIISPMNGLEADAAVQPQTYYPMATTFPIPVSAIPAGVYEVQVQAIDGWGTASAFSEPFVMTVEASPQMEVPTEVYAGSPATVRYIGNGEASSLAWDWNGGKAVAQGDGSYSVAWDTEGRKRVSVTYGGTTATADVLVKPALSAAFAISRQVLATAEVPVTLPEGGYACTWTASKDGGSFRPLADQGISLAGNGAGRATAVFDKAGEYVLRLVVEASGATAGFDAPVTVCDALGALKLRSVTADAATGKYAVAWTYGAGLSDIVSHVNIYKEGSSYGDFRWVASVPVSQTSYTDMASDPQTCASRYRLSAVGTDGTETACGTPHKGVHVMLNKGAGNSWNLVWNAYEGATVRTYRILRGTSPENLAVIAEVAGSLTSYTDGEAPGGILYYALDFNCLYGGAAAAAGRRAARAGGAVRSNVASTETASELVLAEGIALLGTPRPEGGLQMVADVYPLNATFRKVNWSIVDGSGIAEVDQDGFVTLVGDANGKVTVRASAIDGSGVYADMEIQAGDLTDIEEAVSETSGVQVSLSGGMLYVRNLPTGVPGGVKVAIYDLNGRMVHAEKTMEAEIGIPCDAFPGGMYLLRLVSGTMEETKKFILK